MDAFHAVYKGLQEVFPQVDSRILKVVAKENPQNLDVAMEVVLSEILPYLCKNGGFSASVSCEADSYKVSIDVKTSDNAGGVYSTSPKDGVHEEVVTEQNLPRKPEESSRDESGMSFLNVDAYSPNTGAYVDNDSMYVDASAGKVLSDTVVDSSLYEELPSSAELAQMNCQYVTRVNDVDPSLIIMPHGSPESSFQLVTEPVSRATKDVESKADVSSLNVLGKDPPEFEDTLNTVRGFSMEDLEKIRANGVDSSLYREIDGLEYETELDNSLYGEIDGLKFEIEPVSLATKVVESKADVSSLNVLEKDLPEFEDKLNTARDLSINDLEKIRADGVDSSLFSEIKGLESETDLKDTATSGSGQMSTTELLEDFIENEKTEKIALCSAKDSLFDLVNEVDLKEQSVCKAREEAALGGLHTFARAEDLKKIVLRAKEANDMTAGEVYGEKAILATEARELRSRLHGLSEERVKALAILDEIRQVLEVRLSSAEKEIKEAESEKLNKEESARTYLAHEESTMEEVVQKSKILQQQAEENSKIREFLMDRGQVVDVLQGELSVICQDVQLMKAKFDQNLPLSKSSLSKSLSYSQCTSISTCTSSVAVNSVSEKEPDSEKVPEVVVSQENQKNSLPNSPDNQLIHKDVPSTGEEFNEDDWEIFDNSIYSAVPEQ